MKNKKYEFMGPHGPIFLIFGIPSAIFILLKIVEKYKDPGFSDRDLTLDNAITVLKDQKIFKWSSFFAVLGWVAFQLGLYKVLPGEEAHGLPLDNGSVLSYPINGMSSFISTGLLATTLFLLKGPGIFLWIAKNLNQLCFSSTILSIIFSILLYIYSYRSDNSIVKKSDTKFFIYDFWMGRELNPRIFGIDIKHFFELRPGLMGWILVAFSLLVTQRVERGTPSTAMLLVFASQLLYVTDALKNEISILSTSDITKEGFGCMLCMGSMVVEPFFYTIQANYLQNRNLNMPLITACALIFLNSIGMYIFRASNSQKDHFRRCFNSRNCGINSDSYIIARDGKPLLHAGWWGLARHINYFGDWLVSLSWCLATGISSIVPYLYILYFTVLLLHRKIRDENYCRAKKGNAWKEYCRIVPWRFVPYIF